jgi:drug/metabolite transporter (DMT)-like permease
MTSDGWAWAGALLIAVAFFVMVTRRIPERARHKSLARIGAALAGAGCGLISPAYHEYNHPPLEIAAAVLAAVGTMVYSWSCLKVVDEQALPDGRGGGAAGGGR